MTTKAVKARSKSYLKTTRALLRHLRNNGGVADARAQELRSERAQALARLVHVGKNPQTSAELRGRVADLLVGAAGINDQIDAVLEKTAGTA